MKVDAVDPSIPVLSYQSGSISIFLYLEVPYVNRAADDICIYICTIRIISFAQGAMYTGKLY